MHFAVEDGGVAVQVGAVGLSVQKSAGATMTPGVPGGRTIGGAVGGATTGGGATMTGGVTTTGGATGGATVVPGGLGGAVGGATTGGGLVTGVAATAVPVAKPE